jgi:hypothetical protein
MRHCKNALLLLVTVPLRVAFLVALVAAFSRTSREAPR